MVEQADRLGFPLILLPNDVGFDDILNQVLTDILNRQAAVLARAEEAHRALVQVVLAGGGLREVTAEVAGLLDVAVAAVDGAGRMLATAGPPSTWRRCARSAGRPEVTRHVDAAGFGAATLASVPVVAGGHHHGRIVAYSPVGSIGDSDIGILERAATVAALVVTRQEAVTAVESKYRADFLRDVLTGRAGSAERVAPRARAFGWDLERPVHRAGGRARPGGRRARRPGPPGHLLDRRDAPARPARRGGRVLPRGRGRRGRRRRRRPARQGRRRRLRRIPARHVLHRHQPRRRRRPRRCPRRTARR